MDKQTLITLASNFIETLEDNYVKPDLAISENLVGMKIFNSPIFGFGSPSDEYFSLLKEPEAIGNHFKLPKEWLSPSETVISFFLPFTEQVKSSNSKEKVWPSNEWLHGRIEGQVVVKKLCYYLQSILLSEGYTSIIPSLDEGFWSKGKLPEDSIININSQDQLSFTSNWSERHVAFVCGLGTFSLSKGLITEKGIAGRFGSLVTSLPLTPDKRKYTDIYEYCTLCGACIKQCPVNAISLEKGKNHLICSDFLDITAKKFKPRYGCGKCQVSIPCENKIPVKTL